ncbi:threonine synthase [Tenacibaculum sp. 190524A02b]|uniref:Threonine synthase n=1 Tax=Tenacibaculum vairaonense TaxID=3137860 RepID=A0ABM9PRV6_9FLAO
MVKYISITGGGKPVDFETTILAGYAPDGGLYVPQELPKISKQQLQKWKSLDYIDLAFEILSLFIDRSIISSAELKQLLKESYVTFEKENIIPLHPLKSIEKTYIMELFHGPTISFKDVGLAFLVNLVNFFLKKRNERLSLIVATTGDTGPATAHYAAGKSNLDAWVLYPQGKITQEQERQITTLPHSNIHPVSVANCKDGADDLDAVIKKFYAKKEFRGKLKLSSVNSINWGRIMMQTVHYFYGYFQVVDTIGERVHMSVPSGGFGNLCAGSLAKEMGLPITTLLAANNKNACLHRIFSQGFFSKEDIHETASSAIDILIPMNFWRHLFFRTGKDPLKIKAWKDQFESTGFVEFDNISQESYKKDFLSYSASDKETLNTIKEIYENEGYLLDPHGSVAVVTAKKLKKKLGDGKVICLATAHPSKFPDIIKNTLGIEELPKQGKHHSIETAKKRCQKVHICDHSHLEEALQYAMEANWDLNKR